MNRSSYILIGLTVVLILLIGGSLMVRAYDLSFSDFLNVLQQNVLASSEAEASKVAADSYLLFQIRLPRILLAGLTGAGLAITGAAIQGLFRNPLADPSLIGITSGAMLFAVLAIVLMTTAMAAITGILQQFMVVVFAFLGGISTTYLVYFLSRKNGKTYVMTMLLAGVAITALAGAVTGVFIYLSDDQQLRDITFWSLGSFSGTSWTHLIIAIPIILPGIFLLDRYANSLNAIMLGEHEAQYLGVRVEKVKTNIILLTSVIVGVCIALSGIIGFVGLVIPHFIRLLNGSDYRELMKYSALGGAIFMIMADNVARVIIAPAELPIGILSALIGGPFFLWLLVRVKKEQMLI